MKINWKQKLSSRKFWCALIGFITPVLVAFNVPNVTVEQVSLIISGLAGLVIYVLAEGNVDANRGTLEDVEPIELVYPEEVDE